MERFGQVLRENGNYCTGAALQADIDEIQNPHKTLKPVPLNKVGDYCEGEDGNTSLPVEHAGVKSMAILDSGAGVAIATKAIWESWEKPT